MTFLTEVWFPFRPMNNKVTFDIFVVSEGDTIRLIGKRSNNEDINPEIRMT